MKIAAADWVRLEAAAREAIRNSYSPYSGFPVGAAILTASGEVYSGCNIENVHPSLTLCAERTAIFLAAAQGHRRIRAVVIYTPTPDPIPPCGACRRVIQEFGPQARIRCICDTEDVVESSLARLLPGAFGPQDLAQERRI